MSVPGIPHKTIFTVDMKQHAPLLIINSHLKTLVEFAQYEFIIIIIIIIIIAVKLSVCTVL